MRSLLLAVALSIPFQLLSSAATPAPKRLIESADYWKHRLSIDDWTINVEVVRRSELKPNCLGHGHWNFPAKTIKISVLDRSDYGIDDIANAGYSAEEDQEVTIVHELVHLLLAPLRPGGLDPEGQAREVEEQAVVRLTSSLLRSR